MFIKDSVVSFVWDIEKNVTVYAEDYFDLDVTDPDGIVTYYEGVNAAGWTDAYLAPVELTDGQISGSLTLGKTGLWTIVLATGSGASYNILNSQLVMVVDSDLVSTKKIVLG